MQALQPHVVGKKGTNRTSITQMYFHYTHGVSAADGTPSFCLCCQTPRRTDVRVNCAERIAVQQRSLTFQEKE